MQTSLEEVEGNAVVDKSRDQPLVVHEGSAGEAKEKLLSAEQIATLVDYSFDGVLLADQLGEGVLGAELLQQRPSEALVIRERFGFRIEVRFEVGDIVVVGLIGRRLGGRGTC